MDRLSEDDLVELQLLRAQEIDELVDAGFIDSKDRFNDEMLSSLIFPYDKMTLKIETGEAYPAIQLTFEVANESLPRVVVDSLRVKLRGIVADDEDANNLDAWGCRAADDPFGSFQFKKTALRLAQTTRKYVTNYRDALKRENDHGHSAADETTSKINYKNDNISLNGVAHAGIKNDATAASVLNMSMEDICSLIPPLLRILHVESVIRSDLYAKFSEYQEHLRDRLMMHSEGELRSSLPSENVDRAVPKKRLLNTS